MLLLLADAVSFADEVSLSPAIENIEIPSFPVGGDYGMALIKMFLTLIAILGLFFLSYWFLRKLVRSRLEKGAAHQTIQILEKRMISAKTMLYLVEVDQKKILLAESQLEIKKLESFPPEPTSSQ